MLDVVAHLSARNLRSPVSGMRLDVKEEAPWRMLRVIDIGKEKQLNLILCLCPSNFRCGSVCMTSDLMSKFCVYCWAWVLLFVCI